MKATIRCAMTAGLLLLPFAVSAVPLSEETRTRVIERYGELPLSFELNQGQWPSQVKFASRGAGYTLFLTSDEAVLHLLPAQSAGRPSPAVIRSRLLGSRSDIAVTGENIQAAKLHYLIGGAPSGWHRNLPLYSRLRYREVLPGIDLVYYGNQHQLEYDFIVAPQADPSAIRLRYSGMDRVEHDATSGDLHLHTGSGTVSLRKPVIYQEVAGQRTQIDGDYAWAAGENWTDVSFTIGTYDRAQPLVIDPVVAYASYLGSYRGDQANGIAVDAAGNAYVVGSTSFANFPTTPGSVQPLSSHATAGAEAFVTKLAADGRTLVYSTYLGGSSYDHAAAIAIDEEGHAYVTGNTGSPDFPTVNPLQAYAGGGSDVFVSKLSPDGSALLYSTYVGGANPDDQGWDYGQAIAVNYLGQAYVTGQTGSPDFPVVNARQPGYGGGYSDAFVLRLSADGRRLNQSSFLGGTGRESGNGIAVVPGTLSSYVVGGSDSHDFPLLNPLRGYAGNGDAFVTKLDAQGQLLYSTYLGGRYEDAATSVGVDAGRRATIAGLTDSDDFLPLQNGLQAYPACTGFGCRNAFLTRLSANGSTVNYSTYFGGSDIDVIRGLVVDANGNANVTGETYSSDFPVHSPLQHCAANRGQYSINIDAFVARINVVNSQPGIVFSSCLGSSSNEFGRGIALDGQGHFYLAGAASGGFPTTADAFQPLIRKGNNTDPANNLDAFVAKLAQDAVTQPDVIEFAQPVFGVYEDQGVAYIRVTRSGSGYGSVSIRVLRSGGTAVEGTDYDDIDAGYALSWSHGQTGSRRHTLLLADDGLGEGLETVDFVLEAPAGYGLAVQGAQNSATLRIRER